MENSMENYQTLSSDPEVKIPPQLASVKLLASAKPPCSCQESCQDDFCLQKPYAWTPELHLGPKYLCNASSRE